MAMLCKKCDNELIDGQTVCEKCGTKAEENVAPQSRGVVAPAAKRFGIASVLSIIGFSISVYASIFAILSISECRYDYYLVNFTVLSLTIALAQLSLGLCIPAVVIAGRKNQKLKPMGIVGIVLGVVETLIITILAIVVLTALGTY